MAKRIVCDLCGSEIEEDMNGDFGRIVWEKVAENGDLEVEEDYDMCEKCEAKVVGYLEKLKEKK